MPLVLFVLIVVLIAHIGFWDTLAAILGAAAMIALLVLLALAALALAAALVLRRLRR